MIRTLTFSAYSPDCAIASVEETGRVVAIALPAELLEGEYLQGPAVFDSSDELDWDEFQMELMLLLDMDTMRGQ